MRTRHCQRTCTYLCIFSSFLISASSRIMSSNGPLTIADDDDCNGIDVYVPLMIVVSSGDGIACVCDALLSIMRPDVADNLDDGAGPISIDG